LLEQKRLFLWNEKRFKQFVHILNSKLLWLNCFPYNFQIIAKRLFKIINKLCISLIKLMMLLEVMSSKKLIHYSFNIYKKIFFSFFWLAFIPIGIIWLIILKFFEKKKKTLVFYAAGIWRCTLVPHCFVSVSKYILVHSPHIRERNVERKRLWNIPERPSILYTLGNFFFVHRYTSHVPDPIAFYSYSMTKQRKVILCQKC